MVHKAIHHIDKVIEQIKRPAFILSFFVIHVLYVLFLLGIVNINISYLETIHIILQIGLCFFLIYRFNPLRRHVLKEYDGEIIFGSAILLLYNLGLTEFLSRYFTNLSTIIIA